ncbi:PLC-like phosphodiesterase [Tothia fuscella]|uniref:PLC-like phosphodiesterase n=1 Tax=Tothia fuscella TaxID=1048955 RepID=A0A9P4NHH8_9PEZI|nr:PLC-like phosphodiesterase [Tothia fuscella]
MQVFGVSLLVASLIAPAVSLPLSLTSLTSLFTRADPLCNGYPQLCTRKYSEITFVGTHDSAFIGPLPSQNQEKSLTDQLNAGIRFLQSQTQRFEIDKTPHMCHTDCALEDGGSVESYLREVKGWLDKNTREVITVLLTNPDKFGMDVFDGIFRKVGIEKFAFRPKGSPDALGMGDWPTLGEMIDAGQRLVVFVDYGADEKAIPYILDEFNHFFETPFESTDKSFNQCKLDRANKKNPDGKSSMYIMNHNLQVKIPFVNILLPDRNSAGRTNAVSGDGSIGDQVDTCKGTWGGRQPNVVLVDYFNRGESIKAQRVLNGL